MSIKACPNPQLIRTAKALRLQKGLSQNFLIDDALIAAIVQATVDGAPSSMPIVEIGAGGGFLTAGLLETGHPITAIDVDARMAKELTARFGNAPQFHLIHRDVRQVDLVALLRPQGRIVGNLPYHLTGPILFQLLGELDQVDYPLRACTQHMVLMVQKEVGERLTASPGHSAYGQLTLQAQFWCDIETLFPVPRKAFYPSPAVDSVVVKLTPRLAPRVVDIDLKRLSRLIKTAFMHRRKTLFNNLKIAQGGGETDLKIIFSQLDIAPTARPQELSIEQFGALCHALPG